MNGATYEATVVNGQIRLPANVTLPENSKVLIVVPGNVNSRSARVSSPRLANPAQAIEFEMEVREATDAGL